MLSTPARRAVPIFVRPFSTTKTCRTTHKSQEPLAQKLNIDDPSSGSIRDKAQEAQATSENTTEPPTTHSTDSKTQPTQEPEAQRSDKDEPPVEGLRGKTQEAMKRSENVREAQ